MEALGYVTRQHLADNRKNLHVFLTPRGMRLKGVLVPLGEEINAVALQGISAAAVATTRRSLLAMIENLVRDSGAFAEHEARPAPDQAVRAKPRGVR